MLKSTGDPHLDLLALCSLTTGEEWGVIARQADREGSLDSLMACEVLEATKRAADVTLFDLEAASSPAKKTERISRADKTLHKLCNASESDWKFALKQAEEKLAVATAINARMTSVLDDDYPLNLRFIHNLPPFIFYRGDLDENADTRSIAVVGTRKPSERGLEKAWRIAEQLAERGVTITSGLAKGIDTAAHKAALKAGGRTISVFGTGITHVSPVSNRELAKQIVNGGGLLVSQFFPASPGAHWTFGKRNEVTSGISQGTVVIEASKTSGAKMQARLAYEHGKNVFLIKSLVESQDWAQSMVEDGKAVLVTRLEDITDRLVEEERLRYADKELHPRPFLL